MSKERQPSLQVQLTRLRWAQEIKARGEGAKVQTAPADTDAVPTKPYVLPPFIPRAHEGS